MRPLRFSSAKKPRNEFRRPEKALPARLTSILYLTNYKSAAFIGKDHNMAAFEESVALSKLQLEYFEEGLCAQVRHIGITTMPAGEEVHRINELAGFIFFLLAYILRVLTASLTGSRKGVDGVQEQKNSKPENACKRHRIPAIQCTPG